MWLSSGMLRFILVDIDGRLRGAYCLHYRCDIEAMNTSATSISVYQTTRLNIPEDSHIQVTSWLLHLDPFKWQI
jgi:hypothetical protein